MSLSINIKAEWVLKLGPCLPCRSCGAVLEGARWNLEVTTGDVTKASGLVLCQTCYDKSPKDVDLS